MSGETDTVNDEPHDFVKLAALLASAYTVEGICIWLGARNRWIAVAERMVGLTWQEATSPAVGAEVRVKWGVRCSDAARSDEVREWAEGSRRGAEKTVDLLRIAGWPAVALLRRTVTTYADGSFLTSAWQPVTDEEGNTDAAH